MENRNDYDVPREWTDDPPPSDAPESDWVNGYFIDEDESQPDIPHDVPHDPPNEERSLNHWFGALSPKHQIGYGCLAIIALSALLLYCVGAATVLVRPIIAERAVNSPTPIIRPTLVPTPTQQVQPTFIQLPPGKLVATPTQAPMPTREPPTVTPTTEIVNGMTVTPSPSPTAKTSPTRKVTVVPTVKLP